MRPRLAQLLPAILAIATVLVSASGCKKSARELAEEQAIQRHERDEQQKRDFIKLFRSDAGREQLQRSVNFLASLAQKGRLPGLNWQRHGMLRLEKLPVIKPDGPYFWSQEFHVILKGPPDDNLYYVVAQTYSNSDFTIVKGWQADGAGKVSHEFPIAAPPPMLGYGKVFLGPGNPGAEADFDQWYNGVEGSGVVAVSGDDPLTGVSCFVIGITNAAAWPVNHADLRSVQFSLGDDRTARGPFTFSFNYKLPGAVKAGDNLQVCLRFFDESETNYLGGVSILVGSDTGDSAMTYYKMITTNNIVPPKGAAKADVWVVANIFSAWTSGTAEFDDFSVSAAAKRSW